MWTWISHFVLLLVTAASITVLTTAETNATDYSDCATNLFTLERALYETGNNSFELNRIFFPPSLLPTRFVRVNYNFTSKDNETDNCDVTYIWAVGGALFLQPPTLFKFTSLFFYYPNNELTVLSLKLPFECIQLITGMDETCNCSHDSHMLDILTQQVYPPVFWSIL